MDDELVTLVRERTGALVAREGDREGRPRFGVAEGAPLPRGDNVKKGLAENYPHDGHALAGGRRPLVSAAEQSRACSGHRAVQAQS